MNEYEVIVFEDDRIHVLPEYTVEASDDEVSDSDDQPDEIDNIFCDDHIWDQRPTFRYRFRPQYWNFLPNELIWEC